MFEGIQQGLKKRSVLVTGHGVVVAGELGLCVIEGRERTCQRDRAEKGRALWTWAFFRLGIRGESRI